MENRNQSFSYTIELVLKKRWKYNTLFVTGNRVFQKIVFRSGIYFK